MRTFDEIKTLMEELRDSGWCAETEARRKMARAADALGELVAAREAAAREPAHPERVATPTRFLARSVATHFDGFDCVLWFRPAGSDVADVLISLGKPESQLEALARDASSLFSLARQFGVPFDCLRGIVSRDADGAPATILGHALDVVSREMKGLAS